MSEYVVDAIVMLDGENGGFFSYMNHDEAVRLQECGLGNADQVHLKETKDRPVPDHLKKGESIITDVWVKLQPNMIYYLN